MSPTDLAISSAPTGYTAGRGSFVLPAGGARIADFPCLEAMFSGLARESAIEGADFFVSLSDDAVVDARGRTLPRSEFDSRPVLNGTVRAAHVRSSIRSAAKDSPG